MFGSPASVSGRGTQRQEENELRRERLEDGKRQGHSTADEWQRLRGVFLHLRRVPEQEREADVQSG